MKKNRLAYVNKCETGGGKTYSSSIISHQILSVDKLYIIPFIVKEMKRLLIFISTLLAVFPISSAQTDIPLDNNTIGVLPSGGRTISEVPSATLDGTELTLSYPLSTESQVILIDQSTQTTVYSETFAASRSVVIDLAEEGLEEGTYTLHVYAFGKWWWGEFELDY